MPILTVEGPAVADLEKKRKFVAETSRAAAELFSMPVESIVVILKENDPSNVGVGGTLVSDRNV